MLTLRTAFKNIIAGGKRTWLNVVVLSFTFVLMVLYNGFSDGWMDEARRETKKWETGAGQLWHPHYDRYDIFSLQDAHGTPPEDMGSFLTNGTMTPVLVVQGVIYPQQRMQNVLLNGIDPEQNIVDIPSAQLVSRESEVAAAIGKRMAKSADLSIGEKVMLRWRDRSGAFDAKEITIITIFDTKVPTVDVGQIWLNLNDLQQMTGMEGEATYLVKSEDCQLQSDSSGWVYKDLKFLMSDLNALAQGERVEEAIIFAIVLLVALLAVFDTQMLSIFRRQREIGTYVALGMTPWRVTALFTIEGTNYSLLGVIIGAVWGAPVLAWIGRVGINIPGMMDDMGIAFGDAIYPVYSAASVTTIIIIIVTLSAVISFIPARRIAKQNVVDALKGKM